jgi:hypothetical protein
MYYRIILYSKKKYYHQNSMLNFNFFLESPRFTRASQKISGGGRGSRDLGQGGGASIFLGGDDPTVLPLCPCMLSSARDDTCL